MKISSYSTHPAADLFPLLGKGDLVALQENIQANGLINPIVLCDGQILDGRNRALACEALGLPLRTVVFVGGNPWDHVWALNAERRHLEPFQKAALAVKFSTASESWRLRQEEAKEKANRSRSEATKEQHRTSNPRRGEKSGAGSTEPRPEPRRQAQEIAATASVSSATVKRALELRKKNPKAFEAVCRGELPGRRALGDVKRAERMEDLAATSRENTPLTGELGRFPVIYADPPWRYEHVETESRAIENQYPTMDLDAICALDVPAIATADAVLFLWATTPKLAEAMRVIEAWGFTYRSGAVWVKDKIGMGYYFRQRHELLLIATRGNPPTPAPADRPDSVIEAPREKHSAKPAAFAEAIERMYPQLPKIELFCRSPRSGWKSWGNEAA